MAETDKIYDKLIEVAEDVSSLRATYEEGRTHAMMSAAKNDEDHRKIFAALNGKVDKEDMGLFTWVQHNPKFVFVIILLIVVGISNIGINEIILKLAGK